jgi:transposase InsO family protein
MGDSLMFYRLTIGVGDQSVSVRALLDSGASHTFISAATMKKFGAQLPPPRRTSTLRVRMPDGRRLFTNLSVRFPVGIGTWRGYLQAWILDLPEFEFVLGRDFLAHKNPHIDWITSVMTLRDHRRSHRVEPLSPFRDRELEAAHINLISGQQARRALKKKGTTSYLLAIRAAAESNATIRSKILEHADPHIQSLLTEYSDVAREELPDSLPPERQISHDIDTGDAKPVNINSYPLSDEKMREQMDQVDLLLKKGLIRPSASPWGFPVLFVKKSNGKWRMCIDYRALNQVTAKNGYPLPRIQELLDQVGDTRVLSKIDLASGFWQVRLTDRAVPKTAFNTIWGKYEWLAMPFGLCNAPATFQTLMNDALRPFLGKFVVVYLDDILIFSKSKEEHYEHLRQVLEVLRKEKLITQPDKCTFATNELEFCGHVIGNGQVRPMPAKVEIVKNWPRPRNVHEVRQFLGLATYYRRFIRGFAAICVPLHELLKESDVELRKQKFRPIRWSVACECAFRKVKEMLTAEPVLIQPDLSKPFVIETDASEWAIGMVLLQIGPDGKLHPVAYDGRKLTGAELNYPVHEKELLAIKEALRLWDRYIENGTQTTVVTDHASLQYLQTTVTYSKRLARWVDEFQEYDLKIQYRKGSEAVVPDALSRRPDFIGDGPANVSTSRPIWDVALAATQAELATVMGVPEDEWLSATVHFLDTGKLPTEKPLLKAVRKYASKLSLRAHPDENERERQLVFTYEDGIHAPYLEPVFRGDLVNRMHSEFGHLGWPGLNGVVRPRAWWPQMRKDIESAAHNCPNCQVSQGSKESLERETPQHMVTAGIRPFERWGIDLIGVLPTTPNGNRWIITAIDYATGWPVAKAVPEATEEALGQFLHEQIFMNYGAPLELISDNGTNLLSGAVEYYLNILKTRHRTTTPYHPRTNGKVENLNGLLGRMLTKYLMGKPTRAWDLYLTQAVVAARIREHAVTKLSPFYLVYGVHPRLPGDDLSKDVLPFTERAEELRNLSDARTKANELLLARAIRTNRIRDSLVTKTSFKVDDWVLVRNEAAQKYEVKWFGPYKVLSAYPLGTYALAEPNGRVLRTLINGSRLVEANVDDPKSLWSSQAAQSALRRKGLRLRKPEEILKIIQQDDNPPSYHDLSTFTREEWEQFKLARADGARPNQVGEGQIAEKVLDRRRKKIDAENKRKGRKVKDWEELQSGLSDEETTDRDNSDEDVTSSSVHGPRDADAHEQTLFDGPFAVMVPTDRA